MSVKSDRRKRCVIFDYGFTLIELLVVIAIIAILAAVLLPVLGFSAGGHLAARMGTHFRYRVYGPVDGDDTQIRPDFAILIYPAYLLDEKGRISNEVQVSENSPPTFFVANTGRCNRLYK